MKGIILAAGKGTRLYPITKTCCKPLLPIYDKPMIYYPLTTLIQAGIRDILVIVPGGGREPFESLLGDGTQYGVNISYAEQFVQRGIADAFIVGREFIGGDSVCLILGDNIFHGSGFGEDLEKAAAKERGATVFGYYVEDPRPFGVVEFDENGKAISIEEKPQNPKSHFIVPGIYFYDNRVADIAAHTEPSARGELEITSVNNDYMAMGELNVIPLGRDFCWFDTGNAESMYKATGEIRRLQLEAGNGSVGCPEEAAYKKGFVSREALHSVGDSLKMTNYGQYLMGL